MSIFGSQRDISFFKHLNRELIGDVITQQAAYYKFSISKTKSNIYGESVNGKFYQDPVLLNCLINIGDQENPVSEIGVDFSQTIEFYFLRDDLVTASLVPEVGDIIMYKEGYYEVDTIVNNQQFVGKDPWYPNSINPLNPGLENFGWNISIICKTHYVPKDKVSITKARL
jgi:signal peptidase I